MFVVGTAGHVDHGKSSLVRALTGINPDRLREEQEREMTIDLGFAWMTLPSGREISIVDVPGHEDFLRNMLAGVGGIDLALLVVAADESVMPQTREHVAILDLLQVPRAVVALTKADLVPDADWLALVGEEVREAIAHTPFPGAPVVPVSALTGRGLDALRAAIDAQLDEAIPRPDLGIPRLPIDRAFTISGFGTIVTGTLAGGTLSVGDTVEIVPGGRAARIRGLQSHKARVDTVTPGMRVAANLVGVDVADLERGQVVARPGTLQATQLVDVRVRAVEGVPLPLKHGMTVDVHTGSAGVTARLRLLDADELAGGEEGWGQLALDAPVAIGRHDRFVLRLPSPSMTLGGGVVVEPHPVRRHRRHTEAVTARLAALLQGSESGALLTLLDERGPLPAADLVRISQMPAAAGGTALAALIEEGAAVTLAPGDAVPTDLSRWQGLVMSRAAWDRAMERATLLLQAFHRAQPLREGMPREEFRSRLSLGADWANAFLERAGATGFLRLSPEWVALAGHRVALSAQDERALQALLARFRAEPQSPPAMPDVEAAVGGALATFLLESGRLVRLSDSVVYDADTFGAMIDRLKTEIGPGKTFTVAQVRDLFGTSRKYAVAFLEEMDRRRITRRIGDERVVR